MRAAARRRVRSVALPAAFALLLPACAVHAQAATAALPIGARVRLQLADSLRPAPFAPRAQRLIGTLVSDVGGTLAVHVGVQDTLRVALTSVERLDVSRGASRARSAVQQALVGAITVGVFAWLDSRENARGSGYVPGAIAVGAGAGALAGVLSPYEHWRTVRR